MAAERSSRMTATGTIPDKAFEPTKLTPEPQKQPRPQKRQSMMSATICACIKGLLSLSATIYLLAF